MTKQLLAFSLAFMFAGAVSLRASDAKELWEKTCAKCHGEDGTGQTKLGQKYGVKDYTDPNVQHKLKDEEITKSIKAGVTKDGKKVMPAFGDSLSEDEIKALTKLIRDFKK